MKNANVTLEYIKRGVSIQEEVLPSLCRCWAAVFEKGGIEELKNSSVEELRVNEELLP